MRHLDDVPVIALLRSAKREYVENIRGLIDSEFSSIFEAERDRITRECGSEGASLLSTHDDIRGFRLSKIMREAVNTLCSFNYEKDIDRVRRAIDVSKCFGSELILNYIGRYGEWVDVDRILRMESGTEDARSWLLFSRNELDTCKAKTIANLCKGRVGDFLNYNIEMFIKGKVVLYLENSEIRDIEDSRIIDELFSENDEYMGIMAAKCAVILTKRRLVGIMDGYMERDRPHYYNVIHWLDLGISLPRADARTIVKNAFS